MLRRKRMLFYEKIIVSLLMLFIALPATFAQDTNYQVAVNVMVVPIFAVDGSGNPVYNLKKEELQVSVNGKPVRALEFKRYEFGTDEKIEEKIKTSSGVETAKALARSRERVLIIIADTMFNSLTGFRRSKQIIANMIEKKQPSDQLVILENHPVTGLRYIAGPEGDKKILLGKVRKDLVAPPDKWKNNLYSDRLTNNTVDFNDVSDGRMGGLQTSFQSTAEMLDQSEKFKYQHNVKRFAELLSQFKYALKTIEKPKVVFLISEGVATGAFKSAIRGNEMPGDYAKRAPTENSKTGHFSAFDKEARSSVFDKNKIYSAFLMQYLVKIVQSINQGGSVLYSINPKRGDDTQELSRSGEMSLRYLASESGGKYFAGSKPAEIVNRVKKTTAAYYEVFFTVMPGMGANMKIDVKCKRPGVKVHSLMHSERNRPYRAMPNVQKKIFALNVATRGTWSRLVGKVMKVKYKKAKSKKDSSIITVKVPLPAILKNKKADIFMVSHHPKTQKTDVNFAKQKVGETVTMKYKRRKGVLQFFVIIEPNYPHCIYSQLK